MDRAIELIKLAYLSGADYAKFQKRNPIECVPFELQNCPHPNRDFAYGNTYLEHRQNLELDIKQHIDLKQYCNSIGIEYSTSVWDLTSAREIIGISPKYIKIPSACNNHEKLLDVLFFEFDGDVHISLGMTDKDEKVKLFDRIFNVYKCPERVVIYHCTSEYPCPFERLYLKEVEKLKIELLNTGIRTGFSNHGYGISADIAAYVLGATWIERHFIDDRTVKHTDAAASLEPDGLRKLSRDLKNIQKSLEYKKTSSYNENEQRVKLKFRENK